ncbi:MAG: FtsX-like permease family protein [Acidimicrobiia bacterium]
MQDAAARVQDATKIYGEGDTAVTALNDVCLQFSTGQYTAIMGPSGSGKSTLLHCTAGLDRLASGSVYIGEVELGALNDRELTKLRRDKVGFIFQTFNLVPTLSAEKNIVLPMAIAGRDGERVVGLGVVSLFVGVAVLSPAFARPVTAFIGSPLPAVAGVSGNLARENSMRSPRRTSATAAALMVGLALVALVAIIAQSLRSTVSDVLAESFLADFVVQQANPFAPPGGLPTAIADDIADLEEVSDVSRVRFSQAKVEDSVVFLGAIESNYTSMFDLDVTEGTLSEFSGNQTAVLRGWAEGQALGLGDVVSMQFAATGADVFRITAVYEEETAGPVLIPLDAYEANFVEQLDGSVYVLLAPGVSAQAGRAAVEVATAQDPNASVLDATGFQEQTEEALDQLLNVFIGLLSLAILISILGITNTLSLSVIERTREIGLLRAIGMSRRQVRRTIRWEAVITSLFGAVLGIAIGILFAWSIVQALEDQGIRFTVPVGQLILLIIAAGLAGVLAAIPPAARASNLDILEAIAYE